VPVEMWKTDLNFCNYNLYPSTGVVEKLWIKTEPVDKNGKNVSTPLFPQVKKPSTCGNVENFCLIADFYYTN
jgi:hypothetical protein